MNVQVRPSRDLRNKYHEISKLVKGHSPVIITNNGKGDAVLISIEDYAGYERYSYEKYIVAELARRKEIAKNPDVKWYDHDEFWNIIESNSEDV